MAPLTDTTARLTGLGSLESHYYSRVLRLATPDRAPALQLGSSVSNLLAVGGQYQPHGVTQPPAPAGGSAPLDSSCLEDWRVPDPPGPAVLTSLRDATAALARRHSRQQQRLLLVREAYTSR